MISDNISKIIKYRLGQFQYFSGLFIPCVIETIFLWPNFGVFNWKLIKNLILGTFSIIALIAGTIISINDVIELYS